MLYASTESPATKSRSPLNGADGAAGLPGVLLLVAALLLAASSSAAQHATNPDLISGPVEAGSHPAEQRAAVPQALQEYPEQHAPYRRLLTADAVEKAGE
jgi:hypothetical protein